jgi:hypothetical protein
VETLGLATVMRKLLFAVLVFVLVLNLASLWKESIPTVSGSPDMYQGDLILNGNNVTTIENMIFDINGSIIVEGNATLILKNAMTNLVQTDHYQHGIFLRNPAGGNPDLQSTNSSITSSYWFFVTLTQNSTATFIDSMDSAYFKALNNSTATVSNSSIEFLQVEQSAVVSVTDSMIGYTLGTWGGSPAVSVTNSTVEKLVIEATSVNCSFTDIVPGTLDFWNCQLNSSMIIAPAGYASNVTIVDTRIESWQFGFWGLTNATLINSQLQYLHCYGYSNVWLINSTSMSSPLYSAEGGRAYFSWYLDVHVVDSVGNGVPLANVSATYPNAELAEAKTTNASGWTTLTLMEKMVNVTGSYPVGNYTVNGAYLFYSAAATVNMTESQAITLTLEGFVIPEFPTFLILPFFVIATLLTAIIYGRKHR